MITRTYSATIVGLQPIKIEVEVAARRGVPILSIIGLPTKSVDEARERVTSTLLQSGVRLKHRRTIVNLAPADLRKTGSGLELAMAVGLLLLDEDVLVTPEWHQQTLYLGELALDGQLKPIRGALPLVLAARQMGFSRVILPAANQAEVAVVSGVEIYPVRSFQELLASWRGQRPLPLHKPQAFQRQPAVFADTLDQVIGQETAKRALQVAAAGGHTLLMVGPPGAGKTMLARSLTSLLPPLTESEALECTQIHSVAGTLDQGLITQRVFRAPHHTTTQVAMIGGTSQLLPGEISLAHRGVLFLDELSEFRKSTLEALRQPLEEGQITISRLSGHVTYPAQFQLIAAANPCACGYHGSLKKNCSCTTAQVQQYQQRLSGPLLDRIDLHLPVHEVAIEHLAAPVATPVSQTTTRHIRNQVLAARMYQQIRFQKTHFKSNHQLTPEYLKSQCQLQPAAQKLLHQAGNNLNLSARSYFKVMKIAQTIADLDSAKRITKKHISEALQYRPQV